MDAVLGASLALPLLAAIAAVILPRRPWVVPIATGLAAAGWVVVAAAERPPTVGRIVAGPVVAAAVAGAALLATARPPASVLGRSGAACAITVLAVAASTGDGDVPDRPLAVGLVVLALLTAVCVRAAGEGVPATLVASLPGAAVGGALLLSDPGRSALVAVLAAVGAVAATAVTGHAGALLPAVVLAVARVTGAAHGPSGRSEGVVWAAVAAAVAVAASIVAREVVRRRGRHRGARPVERSVDLPACAVVVAALVLVAQDVGAVRSAGLLLAAGGALAVASRHPAGLLAAVPGLAAAMAAAPAGTEPVHAAASGAAVLVVLAALLVPPPPRAAPTAWLAPAVAFGVLPLWGWSGATPDAHADTVAVAIAVVAVVAGAVLVVAAARGVVPTDRPGSLGRLRRRSNAADHARTHPTEEVQPTEVGGQASQGVDAPGGAPQRAVALPSRAVPGRVGGGGVGGRRRIRVGPSRSPRS